MCAKCDQFADKKAAEQTADVNKPAQRLYEELNDLAGMTYGDVLEKLRTCSIQAKTERARERLAKLDDGYVQVLRERFNA